MIVDTLLARRQTEGRPVGLGLVGAGFMARGLINQVLNSTPGMQLVSVCNRTPARAAATAIGRAADRLYQLPVRALSVQPGALTLAELPELLPELPLVVVLQGPGDLLGAIALCPQAVAALVEWQALGRVTSRGLERRTSRTYSSTGRVISR